MTGSLPPGTATVAAAIDEYSATLAEWIAGRAPAEGVLSADVDELLNLTPPVLRPSVEGALAGRSVAIAARKLSSRHVARITTSWLFSSLRSASDADLFVSDGVGGTWQQAPAPDAFEPDSTVYVLALGTSGVEEELAGVLHRLAELDQATFDSDGYLVATS
jgi:hypothetical protein